MTRAAPLFAALLVVGCAPPDGLPPPPDGSGPTITIDWDAEPLPEIPFPNDLATRPDPTSPTGLRLNFAAWAPTQRERDLRAKANQLTGFGVFAPILVAFDAPLDLDAVLDRHGDDDELADDAIYVFDVTPGSPTYLQPVLLDLGGGRFPQDLPRTNILFANDTRADSPAALFDTVDEDLDGDGVLDPGEDTDGDGVLDVPNVHPPGGDPRADLLTWYERETNTLMARPVVPLREQTTYAVVLTERLVDEGGAPVRSPWEYVNHTRQTAALQPVLQALPEVGLTLDDVAFAWTFTTGDITGDLVGVVQGLHGEGPLAWIRDEVPAAISEAHVVQEASPTHMLQIEDIVQIIADAGALPGSDALVQGYENWSDYVVDAAFHTPSLHTDSDGDGDVVSDEWWRVQAAAGEASVFAERVPITCGTPKAGPGHEAPFPVAMIGHGQGGTRFHMLLIAWALNRHGFATCAFDMPGHGGLLEPQDMEEFGPLLEGLGLAPLLEALGDGRYIDLTGDGLPDSGQAMFTDDPFHTASNTRQAAVDFAQLAEAVRACGSGTMTMPDGTEVVSCDFDGDGVPDFGGPDNDVVLIGASLGGITSTLAAAVDPTLSATVSIIPGGGMGDGVIRTTMSGPREASLGRLVTPLVVGVPDGVGGLEVRQIVIAGDAPRERVVATLASWPEGGRVALENLATGEVGQAPIPADGRFRVSVAADTPDPWEKRGIVGMPEIPVTFDTYGTEGNAELGDPLVLRIEAADGSLVTEIDAFEQEVEFMGITYRAGSPLVALAEGSGLIRGSPRLRRSVQILGMAAELGDPVAYAPLMFQRPVDGPINYLMMPTVGDDVVPIANGIALARAVGLYDLVAIDDRYGRSVDRWLVDNEVVHGLEEFGPFTAPDGSPILFDPDDLDDGTDGTGAPSDDPLRATVPHDAGFTAMRIVYADPRGSHGWAVPDPDAPFDTNNYAWNLASWFLASRGADLSEDPCLEVGDCAYFRAPAYPDD